MKSIIALLLLSMFSCISHAQSAEEQVQALLNDYATVVKTLDMELAEKIWATQDDISFIQPRGHQKGWTQIRDNFYLGAMANFSERELILKDIVIRVLNETTAWTDFYWDFEATFKDGKSIQSAGRETQVLTKQDDGWKILHVHYSGMPVTGEREGF